MLRKKLFQSGAILSLLANLALAADTVKLAGRPAFRNVTIVDLDDGRLAFRGVSGELLRKPLADVEWIAVDAAPALAAAERAVARDTWDLALRLHIAAADAATSEWQRTWCLWRQVQAAERCGRFDAAVKAWVVLLQDAPNLAGQATPGRPGPPGSEVNRAARERMETALADRPSVKIEPLLQRLLLQLLVYEEVEPSQAGLQAPDHADPAAVPPADEPEPSAAASQPAIGILPPEPARSSDSSPSRPDLGILPPEPTEPPEPPAPDGGPATQPSTTVSVRSRLELPADSFVYQAIEEALDAGDSRRAASVAALAEPYLPLDAPALRKYFRGLKLLAHGEPADAAAALVPLADAKDAPSLACRALYYGSLAHERLERPDVAAALCRELLARNEVPPDLAARARRLLGRVGE